MGFQKVEFEFPDEGDDKLEVAKSSAEEIDLSGKPKSSTEEDFEVEVVDDTPEEDRGRKPSEPPEDVTDDELENYSEKVRKRIQHFTKGYHDERRAKEQALREREELERLAQKLVDENKKLKGSMSKNEEALVAQAKRSAEMEYESAKRAYREAYETGDSEKVLNAQEALTSSKIKLDRLATYRPKKEDDGFKEETPKSTTAEPVSQPSVQPDEKAVSWAQENPWFGSDDEMTSFALGYHNKLVKEGVDPKSNEYYEKINSRMRQVFPDQFESAAPRDSKPANVVAPATRSKAPKKIRLTQTQVQIAKRLGVPLEEYAKQVAEEMRKQR